MELVMTIIANLLFLVGTGYCVLNFAIGLRNYLHGTHASFVPIMGSLFIAAACLLLPVQLPPHAVLIFLLYDLGGLLSLLLLPFYLLRRALRGAEAAPLLPSALKALLLALYMLGWGILVLASWYPLFIAAGATIPNQA